MLAVTVEGGASRVNLSWGHGEGSKEVSSLRSYSRALVSPHV